MYEFSYEKNRIVNKLIVCAGIYLVVKITRSFNLVRLIIGESYNFSEHAITITEIISISSGLVTAAVVLFIYWFMKRLRETPQTKKLYGTLFVVIVCETALSVTALLISLIINYTSLEIPQSAVKNPLTVTRIMQIYNYFLTLLPVPFMVAIFIKEKLNYNWMIMGSLTSVYFLILSMIIRGIRTLFFNQGVMVNLTFNEKFPMLHMIADNSLMHAIRGYFWLAGLIAMIVIYKKKFSVGKAKEGI